MEEKIGIAEEIIMYQPHNLNQSVLSKEASHSLGSILYTSIPFKGMFAVYWIAVHKLILSIQLM